jgi:hypothetical protein
VDAERETPTRRVVGFRDNVVAGAGSEAGAWGGEQVGGPPSAGRSSSVYATAPPMQTATAAGAVQTGERA